MGRNRWLYDTKSNTLMLLFFGKGVVSCAIKGDGGRGEGSLKQDLLGWNLYYNKDPKEDPLLLRLLTCRALL